MVAINLIHTRIGILLASILYQLKAWRTAVTQYGELTLPRSLHNFRSGYINAELACDPELLLIELAPGGSANCSAVAEVNSFAMHAIMCSVLQ